MKKLIILLLVLGSSHLLKAQYFQTGQDPASLKWRQIFTENFQLIYPDYYEDQAQQLAQKLEKVYDYGSYSLHHKPKKISILLHTQTVVSNGLVAYAPKRSEFYTTPAQDIYPLDWLEQLAVHEFRHVVQLDKINAEMPKIIKALLGQQGTALVFGAYLPWWFIEGDAVSTETALTHYGRGRFPSFLVDIRAQLVEKGKYSYDKAYLGSYKDYVPNHYKLGYYLVANSRARYGAKLWSKVVGQVGKKPLSLNPFNAALKNEIGMNKVGLYQSVFDSLQQAWLLENKNRIPDNISVLSKTPRVYTSYMYSHWLNDGSMLAYRTSLNKVSAFVRVDQQGNEKVIHIPGTIFDESVDYRGEWIVWSEQVSDLRWTHSGRSIIRMFNYKTGDKVSVHPKFKAFAPTISPDFKQLAVVEVDFSNNNYLSVYDCNSGALISRTQTPDNNFLMCPRWLNNRELVVVILTNEGKRLATIQPEKGSHRILFRGELGDIKQLQVQQNHLYFISSFSGVDALYSFNLETNEIKQLFDPQFGVAYPAVSHDGKIALSDYHADGYRLIRLNQVKEKAIEEVAAADFALAETIADQEMGVPNLSDTDSSKYRSTKYSKLKHLLNIHSWAPLFVEPYDYEFSPGASVMSQNVLGTAMTVLGYDWDSSEETGQIYGRYIYKGWYPVFDFTLSAGKRASSYYQITEYSQNGVVTSRDTIQKNYTWNETNLSASTYLPLYLSRGKYYRLLQPEISYELTHNKKDDSTPNGFPDGYYQSMSYQLYYYQLLRSSSQDVWTNFGFVLEGTYTHSPFGSNNLGSITGLESTFYGPGLLPNHGIKLSADTQSRTSGDIYSFSNIISFPRGWNSYSSKKLSVVGLDYKLPLINPDWSLGGLTYIRRITADLFYDYGFLTANQYQDGEAVGVYHTNISSYGVELISDMNFLRFYAPVEIGFRASYLNELSEFSFDFLLSIDFTSL